MFLQIKDLKITYGGIEVVRGLDLNIKKGECVGLVGESGCGKTTVGLSITRLIPEDKAKIISGKALLEGRDILGLDIDGLRELRRKKVSYVFQEPFSSLNPVFTIYEQLKESVPDTDNVDKAIPEVLKDVGLSELSGRKRVYPHELSGGMQQRVMIAMAILSRPDLLILDEPTTALDVTVQNQILGLIMDLKEKLGLSILFISHDLRTVFKLSDKIAVMYAGRIVEEGLKEEIISRPRHPYTIGLIASIPSPEHRKKPFSAIEGKAPLFSNLPAGCKFYPRCKFRIDECREGEPELENISGEHFSRCILAKEMTSHGIIKGS